MSQQWGPWRKGAAAVAAALICGSAGAVDYWTTFTAGDPLTGALTGSGVTVTRSDARSNLPSVSVSAPFTVSDVPFYPASLKLMLNHMVLSPLAASTAATPGDIHIAFTAPLTDPVIAFYSLDTSAMSLGATVQSDGTPAVVASFDTNVPSRIDASVPSAYGPGPVLPAGQVQPAMEGCFEVSRRVCGLIRLRGVYDAVELAQYRLVSGSEGVGYQIGYSVIPVATPDASAVPFGVTQVAVPDLRTNDRLEGGAGTPLAGAMTVATSGIWPVGITLNPATGAVTVDSTVAPGQHVMDYTLCAAADPSNCVTSTVTITVGPRAVPVTTWPGLVLLAGGLLAMAGRIRRRSQRMAA